MSIVKSLGLPEIKTRAEYDFKYKYPDGATSEENFHKAADILLDLHEQLKEMSKHYCDDDMVDRPNVIQYAIEQWTYNKKFFRQFRTESGITDEEIKSRYGDKSDILLEILK